MTDRDTLARAIYETGAYCGVCGIEGWGTCDDCMKVCRTYVLAVVDEVSKRVRKLSVAIDDALAAAAFTEREITLIRVMKGTEERGEAAAELTSWFGANPRKGRDPAARGRLQKELMDEAATALLAWVHVAPSGAKDLAIDFLIEHIVEVAERWQREVQEP